MSTRLLCIRIYTDRSFSYDGCPIALDSRNAHGRRVDHLYIGLQTTCTLHCTLPEPRPRPPLTYLLRNSVPRIATSPQAHTPFRLPLEKAALAAVSRRGSFACRFKISRPETGSGPRHSRARLKRRSPCYVLGTVATREVDSDDVELR